LLHDPDCMQLANLGLVKHVTKMGMTPEQLKHGILEHGNCSDCQQIGMVHERCPCCNESINQAPWCLFVPKWTSSHIFINPRLFSEAHGNTAVPCTVPQQCHVGAVCANAEDGQDDPFVTGLIQMATKEVIDAIVRQHVCSREDEKETPTERFL